VVTIGELSPKPGRHRLKSRPKLSDGVYVGRASTNGGFPIPVENEPVRLVASHHDACSGNTRVRLPRAVPARAVRRVVCDRCSQPYEPAGVDDLGEPRRLKSLSLPGLSVPTGTSLSWRWLSLPVAAVAVAGGLVLIQGGDGDSESPIDAATSSTSERITEHAQPVNIRGKASAPRDATLVSGSTFQLVLPANWEEVPASGGATWSAAATDGDADAQLWVDQDPKLNFATFEARSLDQLETLAGSAAPVRRSLGPTPDKTSALLAPTSAPENAPNYEVLIMGGFDNRWYYLATTTQPGASTSTASDVRLVQETLEPIGAEQ
jgi:hypothetical protein